MTVKIIRPQDPIRYSFEPRKVKIEFKDGSHLIGFINIHGKYKSKNANSEDEGLYLTDQENMEQYNRTSDFLKSCNRNEGVITVFNATYGGQVGKTCFVFLHSVKLIMEEDIGSPEPTPLEHDGQKPEGGGGFSLREKVRRQY